MAGGRSFANLLTQYSHQPPTSPPPTTKLNTLKYWSDRHNWQERVKAWDAYQDILHLEEEKEASRRQHRDRIEEFRRSHESAGIGAHQSVMLATKILRNQLKRLSEDPNPDIKTAEVIRLMSAIASLGQHASDQWAKAIGIDGLLEVLDNGED